MNARQRRGRRFVRAALAGLILLVLLSMMPPFGSSRERAEDNIREAVFRYQFEHNASGLQRKADAYYLSLDGEEPSDSFMLRFRGNVPPVRRRSQSVQSEESDTHFGDPKTERRGLGFGVGEIRWKTRWLVDVAGSYRESGISASGNTYRVIFWNGRWVVIKDTMHWIA